MRRFIASALVLLATAHSTAAELRPFLHEGELGAVLVGIDFPANLENDLGSGLTTRILIRFTLEQPGRPLKHRAAEITIRYDLWDENFAIVTRVDGTAIERGVRKGMRDVRAFLGQIRLPGLFYTAGIAGSDKLTMRLDMLLNPVDRERLETIRKWVAENSKREPLDPAGVLGASDGSLANALFNKIFEQYARGSEVAAIWQRTVSSMPFTLESLSR
jgi:hypothetical protein